MSQDPEGGRRKEWFFASLIVGFDFLRSLANDLAEVILGAPRHVVAVLHGEDKTGRAEDKKLDPERNAAAHEKWGTLWVTCSFLAGIAAGCGFLVVYWYGGNNLLLGGTLAICFGGLGMTLLLWSHWLIEHKEATDPRETMPSSSEEREAALAVFHAGKFDMRRRALLTGMSVAATALLAAIVVSLFRAFSSSPFPDVFNTVWKHGQRLMTMDNHPVSIHALEPGSTVVVFPENSIGDEKAQTVLIRVQEDLLQLPPERAGWAPLGYIAYSRVCTHAGCPVGLYESTTDLLFCPCHQSTFDVLKAAIPTGGPAVRPLPQLPLYVDGDGNLRANGGFSDPPGPGFWGMPCPNVGGGCQ